MIGLLGGSFDPVHTAHLAMADAFAIALSLDELRFVPASQPWQKHGLAASSDDRVAMLHAALDGHRPSHGRFVVDGRELARAGPTYTIDTLIDLRREVGDARSLVFLFGADQLVHLDTWRDWRSLWDHAHLAAVTRPGFDVRRLPPEVADAWSSRLGDAEALRAVPSGRSYPARGTGARRVGDRDPGRSSRRVRGGRGPRPATVGPPSRSRLYSGTPSVSELNGHS